MPNYEHTRRQMVETQIARRGVRDQRVLDAMRSIPREQFVGLGNEASAYGDTPLPIGLGQTISQPFVVARMAEIAEIGSDDRVLEVGTGSGYAAAVLSRVAGRVFTIERHPDLAEIAARRLRGLGFADVAFKVGDGSLGWPDEAPFDAIIVSAGGPSAPASLKRQLAVGGRLVIPLGKQQRSQRLMRIVRIAAADFQEEDLGAVSFVPLIGEEGWPDK